QAPERGEEQPLRQEAVVQAPSLDKKKAEPPVRVTDVVTEASEKESGDEESAYGEGDLESHVAPLKTPERAAKTLSERDHVTPDSFAEVLMENTNVMMPSADTANVALQTPQSEAVIAPEKVVEQVTPQFQVALEQMTPGSKDKLTIQLTP